MSYFLLDKYESMDENILYTTKELFLILTKEKKMHIDKLFNSYSTQKQIELSSNIENILYLSLTFMFSLGIIDMKSSMVFILKEDGYK